MADIGNEIDAIRAAKVGEEVRGEIADALEAMNGQAEVAEAWATGGTGGTPSETNNAEYWAGQAAASATSAASAAASGVAALANEAPTYSSSATYAVGNYVVYDGVLYRCVTAITTAEAWTAAHWTAVKLGPETADVKNKVDNISGDLDYTAVTAGISRDTTGFIAYTDNNELVIYGQPTATRYVGFLNGQNFVKSSDEAFNKTLPSGTYRIDLQINKALIVTVRGTYTTFSDSFSVIATESTNPSTKTITFTNDVMLAFQAVSGRNYGTEENPTRISFRAYKYTAYDIVARDQIAELDGEIDALSPADKTLSITGKAADAEATGLFISEDYNVLADVIKGYPEMPLTYTVGGLGNSDGSKSDNEAFIRTTETSSRRIKKGDVVISDGLYYYSVAIYNTSTFNSASFDRWITPTSYNRKWHCTAIPDEYVGKYFGLKMYKDGSTLTNDDAAAMSNHIKVISAGYNKIGYEKLLSNTDDLDNIKYSGIYRWNSNSIPAHSPKNAAGIMTVAGTPSETYTSQLIVFSDGHVLTRYNNDGTWGDFNAEGAEFEKFLDRCGRIKFTPIKGGITPSGGTASNLACLTTGILDCADYNRIKIITNNNVYINVFQGASRTSLRRTNTWINSGLVNKDARYIAFNMYLVDEDTGENINWQTADFDLDVVLFGEVDQYDCKNDVPENSGVFNSIRRAYQMADIGFTALAPVPYYEGDKPAGANVSGVVYSSVWNKMNGFVPQTVSFHTYMTAAKDPDSYLYTDVGGGDIRRPYYGCVCSTFASYCMGLSGIIATVAMPNLEEFEELDIDTYHDLHLCDMLLSPDEHIAMITGILRDQYGRINSAEVAEAWKPYARRRWIPATGGSGDQNDLAWYFDPANGYHPYRNKNISKVKYSADPWVHVLSEIGTPTYPTTLCPKKGDRSIYSASEHVIIDLIDTSASTGTLSDGTTSTTVSISGSPVDLGTLTNGKWTFTVGMESVSFIVVDVSHSVTPENGSFRVEFTNNNPLATPLNISIHHPTNHGCSGYHVLTAEEIEAGAALVSFTLASRAISVCYSTEYGWYYDGFTVVNQ